MPAPPPATVWCGQGCALGALGPHVGRQPLPWVLGARGTPQDAAQRGCPGKCVCSPALDTAHTFLCSHTQARMCTHVRVHTCACTCCVLVHIHAHVHLCTRARVHVLTRAHTCSQHTHIVYGLVHMHLYMRVLSHTPLHTSPRTRLPVQPYMRTLTFTACTLILHIHTLTCTH